MRMVVLSFAVFAIGCTQSPSPPSALGPVALAIQQAAARRGVPGDLALAIAQVEGGLRLPRVRNPDPDDHVPVAGAFELRHGAFDSLARAAALAGVDELALRSNTDLATEAGLRVLAELGEQTGAHRDDIASWRAAVEKLAGMSDIQSRARYVAEVFDLLGRGGRFAAREGEMVSIAPHPELVTRNPEGEENPQGHPDFPGAIWLDTACDNKCTPGRPDGNDSVGIIVIHDTEGDWNASVATLQNDPLKSVHYIVDADGTRVGQFRSESDTTWHAGNWEINKHSIGIEHVGHTADPNGYSDGLYETSRALVHSIRERWQIPLDRMHIIGHYQVANPSTLGETAPPCSDPIVACESSADYGGAGTHRDPGYQWQWCQYMEKLGGSCACNDTFPQWSCTTDHTEAVRCVNGRVEIDHCTGGCISKPVGQDDICQH
jgi:N-acetyl-anhydromuramyl-L-alanine amidase AmpD